MESGNRDLMDILLRGEGSDSSPQQAIEGFGQQFSSSVTMSGHSGNVQPSLTSPMGQQATRFHAISPSQMVPQSPVGSMIPGDIMSSQYSQSPTSYSDSNYQAYPGFSSQQRMAHQQATSQMGMYQNFGQNGSFMGSIGQYGGQNRSMGHQGAMSSQYPTPTSNVNYGNQNYYSDVYPSVNPKSPASHQQIPGNIYPMPVSGNGSSYPGSGYAGQSSISPMQKQLGQSFFSSRSPAASQIHSPPNVATNFPGQPPTSPMAQPLVGHPRRSSTSPVSPMMPQSMPVYSIPQRQQQYTTTSSSMSPSQLQSSCMFAQRLEKMSAQHQYQSQIGSTTTLPAPSGSSTSRRASFPGQQSHHPGMSPLKSPTGSVSPARRSPPSLGKSPPPFKPLRSPPPYQAKRSPPSFQAPSTKPVPYLPQGKSDIHKLDQLTSGSEELPPVKKPKKSKAREKSSMQKLEEVAEKVSTHLVEGLSHAVGDTVEKKNVKKKSDAKSEDYDQESTTTETKTPVAETLSEFQGEEKDVEMKDHDQEKLKKSTGFKNEKEMEERECKSEERKTDERKTETKDSEMNKCEDKTDISTDQGEVSVKLMEKEINERKEELNEVKDERPRNTNEVEKQTPKNIEEMAEENVGKLNEKNGNEKESKIEKQIKGVSERLIESVSERPIESISVKQDENKSENKGVAGDKMPDKTDALGTDHNNEPKEDERKKEKDSNKMESSKEIKIKVEKDDKFSKFLKSSTPEKALRLEAVLPKETNLKSVHGKPHSRQTGMSVSISRSGHTPTIQATVIAKGQSAQSNQQVLVAKTAGGQMYLIQGNVLIPVQNITVQQPKGEHGNKVICVNQGQGKSSHVMVGNITPNLSQKDVLSKGPKRKDDYEDVDDDDDLDDEIDGKMEIDLACREKTLLSPTAELAENETPSHLLESNTSTVSIQTERHVLKMKPGFQRVIPSSATTKSGLSFNDHDSNLASIKRDFEDKFDDMGESSGLDSRKRIGRPPGSKDKHKRRPYMHKQRPYTQPNDLNILQQKTSSSIMTKSPGSSTTLEKKDKNISIDEDSRSSKRPHSINVPTVSKASKNISKRPKIMPPSLSPVRTLLVQPRGGMDGEAWVCAFCGKPSNHNSLGVLYGPYKAKLSCNKTDSDCRSPDKVLSPGGRVTEIPSELEGSPIELWIHKDCGVWSQGMYMLGRTLYGLEQAVESAASHECSTCSEPGATLQCFKRGCSTILHFACARDSGCAFVEDNFTIFCSSHK